MTEATNYNDNIDNLLCIAEKILRIAGLSLGPFEMYHIEQPDGQLPFNRWFDHAEGARRLDVPDGPLRADGCVLDDEGRLLGTVILFVRDGYLFRMRYSWTAEDVPCQWPDCKDVQARKDGVWPHLSS